MLVEANGAKIAYRRFGNPVGVPLVFFQHFTGTMDNWDPSVIDAFAKDREVILFNNAGISSSGGNVPTSIEEFARYAEALIDVLGLDKVDLLGFSMGGFIAQQIAVDRPHLVRRVVLVGTGPRGGDGMAEFTPEVGEMFGRDRAVPDELWLEAFFTPSEKSQAAGRAFLERIRARKEDRDPPISEQVAPAQLAAIAAWGVQRTDAFAYLRGIAQPFLVINGSNDIIISSINSFHLQQNLPNAKLILYPDGNHGSQYQYPREFLRDVSAFLAG